jgi:hypothetical protein
MADVYELWKTAFPKIVQSVTGRGVWAALNAVRPVALEDGVFVLGFAAEDSELTGHLRIHATQRVIETIISSVAGTTLKVRVIDGNTKEDYEIAKRRDVERRRLQEQELAKMRTEMKARTNWDSVFEQLSRRYAAVTQKSLAQNRARFYEEAIELVVGARQEMTVVDDAAERSFARCIERIAQYVEIPTTIVAIEILKRSGEL